MIGDQQSACLGHLLDIGEVKNTYGTGCFMLMNTGNEIIHSKYGLLTTLLYKSEDSKALYALEGAIETAGSAVNWLKTNLRLFNDYNELKYIYESVENSGGIIFVPAFSGLFSPHWDNTARGLIIGLTSYTQPGHIVRSAYEAIGLRSNEVIKSFENDSSISVKKIKVDGGLTSSDEFLQTQSDVLGIEVEKQKEKEITIIGSAIAAGLEKNVLIWKDLNELKNLIGKDVTFKSNWTDDYKTSILEKWGKAVERSKNWI